MKPRIYVDTSVIGGYLDREFRKPSLALFERFKAGKALIVLSDLTLLELKDAPPQVRAVLDQVPKADREDVEFDEEAAVLADRYVAAGVVRRSKLVDAQHIAIATVAKVDALVSWNFKHIVNLERIRGYNSVNLRHGYSLLEIRTPLEVFPYEV